MQKGLGEGQRVEMGGVDSQTYRRSPRRKGLIRNLSYIINATKQTLTLYEGIFENEMT